MKNEKTSEKDSRLKYLMGRVDKRLRNDQSDLGMITQNMLSQGISSAEIVEFLGKEIKREIKNLNLGNTEYLSSLVDELNLLVIKKLSLLIEEEDKLYEKEERLKAEQNPEDANEDIER